MGSTTERPATYLRRGELCNKSVVLAYKAGLPYKAIARKLGVNRSTVSRDVKHLLKQGHPCRECRAYRHETLQDPFDDSPSANPTL
jgi:hypothetical protein